MNRKPFNLTVLAVFATFAGCIAGAQAQVTAYNNFGPGETWDPNNEWLIVGPDLPGWEGQWVAMDFIPTVSGMFSQLRLALNDVTSFHPLFVRLTDNIDPSLAQFNVDWNFDTDDWGGPPVDLFSAGGPNLFVGQTYWVQVAGLQDEILAWYLPAGQPDVGNVYFSHDDGGSWTKGRGSRSAFRVSVIPDAVPEPSSIVLFAGAVPVALILWRRRRPVS
jgi:hypothetical protein